MLRADLRKTFVAAIVVLASTLLGCTETHLTDDDTHTETDAGPGTGMDQVVVDAGPAGEHRDDATVGGCVVPTLSLPIASGRYQGSTQVDELPPEGLGFAHSTVPPVEREMFVDRAAGTVKFRYTRSGHVVEETWRIR